MPVLRWIPISQTPPTRRLLLFCGSSGYIAPNDRMIVSGYFDPEYRPLSPYLDSQGCELLDCGIKPTHWSYLDPSDFPPEAV